MKSASHENPHVKRKKSPFWSFRTGYGILLLLTARPDVTRYLHRIFCVLILKCVCDIITVTMMITVIVVYNLERPKAVIDDSFVTVILSRTRF